MAEVFRSPSKYETPKKKPLLPSPVFKTPMTYSPRLVGNKPVPSPSRPEIWRKQLGLDDAPADGCDEEESEEEEKHEIEISSHISQAEFRALQKQLEARDSQRDDLLLQIKHHKDKHRLIKGRLEREENTKRQQLKILRKAHDIQIQEKENLICSLQGLVEEQENKILQMEEQMMGSPKRSKTDTTPRELSSGATGKLIEEVKRLQSEKVALSTQLEMAQSEVNTCREDKTVDSTQITHLKQLNAELEKEKLNLEEEISKIHKNYQSSLSTPCSTDTEKQVEKLQEENEHLLQELTEVKNTSSKVSTVHRLSVHRQQQLEEEVKRLKTKVSTLEEDVHKKVQYYEERVSKYKLDIASLMKDKQESEKKNRDMQSEITALQAREPEVVTKVKTVRTEVESEALKSAYATCQQKNTELQHNWEESNAQLQTTQIEVQNLHSKLCQCEEEKASLQQRFNTEIDRVQQQRLTEISNVRQKLQAEMATLRTNYDTLCQKLESTNLLFSNLVESFILLQKDYKKIPRIIQDTVAKVQQETRKAIAGISDYNQELIQKYHREMKLRKKYHNELVELKGNIRVFCRVRPCIREDGSGPMSESIVTYDRDDDGLVYITSKGRTQTFELDQVFTENSNQTEVFNEVKALVTSCIDGYNVCIFAYGQTGSGKTYTMEGPENDPGINQRALQELFHEIEAKGRDWCFTITVSMVEIYNEMIRDLLGEETSYKMEIKMSQEGGLYIPGLSFYTVNTVEDVNQVFRMGKQNRATATTNMNEHSSRSHALLCVTVTGVNRTTSVKTVGKLNLVDLAGSERVSKSGADGARLKEAQNINKSLSCLGDVIHALRSKQSFVPYRNSKLTYLLQDSLGGDSKTLMIVQVAPVRKNEGESICSLNFAQRVRTVELGAATKRVENGDIEKGSGEDGSCGTPSRTHLTVGEVGSPAGSQKSTPKRTAGGTPSGRAGRRK